MSKILQFSKNKAKISNGIVGLKISECIYRIEDKNNRGDWYRKFLGIENALFFSKDTNEEETLIVLDVNKSDCNSNTQLIFAENGINGRYRVPVILMDSLFLEYINDFKNILQDITKGDDSV